jgi:hypothetical protein
VDSAASTGANSTGSPATASSAIAAIRTTSEAIISQRRSHRSARTPPNGPNSTIGNTRAAVVTAVQVTE